MSLPTDVKKMDMISEGIKISLKCCVKDDCNKCIALPCAAFVLEGIATMLSEEEEA